MMALIGERFMCMLALSVVVGGIAWLISGGMLVLP